MARSRRRLERDTCRDVVLPALATSGWSDEPIRSEYPRSARWPHRPTLFAARWARSPSRTEILEELAGREIPDGLCSTRDFERVVSLLVRTELAAHHLSAILT